MSLRDEPAQITELAFGLFPPTERDKEDSPSCARKRFYSRCGASEPGSGSVQRRRAAGPGDRPPGAQNP
jgi:hypothetical protein